MATRKKKTKPSRNGGAAPATKTRASTKAKAKAATTAGRAAAAMSSSATVRMYNVGFGDAFLLSFPADDRARWVLVDCGVHPSGPGPRGMKDVVQDLIDDVTVDGKARIDVVIATHRHADHVSGFKDARWGAVEVGEVWMPWTEDPKDPAARKIREAQSQTALALVDDKSLTGLAREIALNNMTNAEAMDMLHHGFTGKPERRFLPDKKRAKATFTSDALPGVVIHAMGPSHDPDVIRDMNPKKGEAYLQRQEERASSKLQPFKPVWRHERASVPAWVPTLPDDIAAAVRERDELDGFGVVTALEGAVNGTSLVLVFEIGRAVLLFPGDAQWGTWNWILQDDEWKALLAKTSFYKVGHHGSHNATVPAVVDALARPFFGMVSTRADTKNWDIPRGPLLKALRGKKGAVVVRSDKADIKDADCTREGHSYYVDSKIPL